MSTIQPPLGVAIAGLGFGEKVHLPALRACGHTEPVALWHPRQERVEAACRNAELPGHSDFAALLDDPAVDAVVIATPPAPRFALAKQALEAGKHVMLEKPVALCAEDAEELQRLALSKNLTVAVDFEYRAVPLFQQLDALIKSGVLGSENQADYVHGFGLWQSQGGETLRAIEADPRWAFGRTWEDGRIAPVERLHGWWSQAIAQGRPMVPGLGEGVLSQRCCDWARNGFCG